MKTFFAQARLIPLQVCTASLLLFLSPSLSAELRHFLSELCQEGMLTTPGIATLWEFTPLKVFFLSPPVLFVFFLLFFCILCLSFLLLFSVFGTIPVFSHLSKFTLTHTSRTPPLLPLSCIVLCREQRSTSCVVNIQACHQQT